LNAILDNVDHEVVSAVDGASAKIKGLIMDADIPRNIADEIVKQYSDYKKAGGKFIVPVPKVKII